MSYIVPTSSEFLSQLSDRTNYRYYRLKIDGTNVSDRIDAYSVIGGQKKDFAQWSVKLRNTDDAISEGDFAELPVTIEVKAGASVYYRIFTGFVDEKGASKIRGDNSTNQIKLSFYDRQKSKGIKRKPASAVLAGFKVCNPGSASESIFHYLAELTGISTFDAELIDFAVPVVEIGKDAAWQELQKLAELYKADLYYRYDGALRFKSPFESGYSTPTPEWIFIADSDHIQTSGESLINGTIQKSKEAISCNRCEVEFDEYTQLSQKVIYQNLDNYNQVTKEIDITLQPHEYIAGGATDYVRCEYKDPNKGVVFDYASDVIQPTIGAIGSGADIEYTGGNLTLVSFNGSTSATKQEAGASQIILYNDSASACRIAKFQLRGKPFEIEREIKVSDIDPTVVDDTEIVEESLEGKYAATVEQVQASCTRTVNEGKDRRKKYKFISDWCPVLQRGMIATLKEQGKTDVTVKIESFQHKNNKSRFTTEIEAIEYGEVSASGTAKSSITTPSLITSRIISDQNEAIEQVELKALTSTVPNATIRTDSPIVYTPFFYDDDQILYININDGNTIYLMDLFIYGSGTKLNTVSSAFPVYIGDGKIAYINQEDGSKIYIKNIGDTETGTAITSIPASNLTFFNDYIYFIDDDFKLKKTDVEGNVELVLDEEVNFIEANTTDLLITKLEADGIFRLIDDSFEQIVSGIYIQSLTPFTSENYVFVDIDNNVYKKKYSNLTLSELGDLIYEEVSCVVADNDTVLLVSAVDGNLYTYQEKTDLDLPVQPEKILEEFSGDINIGSRLILNIPIDDMDRIELNDELICNGIISGTKVLSIGNDYIKMSSPATLNTAAASIQIKSTRLRINANRLIVDGSIKARALDASAISSKAKDINGDHISDINLDTGVQIFRNEYGTIKLFIDPVNGIFRFSGDLEAASGTFNGDLEIASDDEDRSIKVGSKGLLATDNNGAIMHDIAVDPAQTGASLFKYVGHLYSLLDPVTVYHGAFMTQGIYNVDISSVASQIDDLTKYNGLQIYTNITLTAEPSTVFGKATISDLGVYNDSSSAIPQLKHELAFSSLAAGEWRRTGNACPCVFTIHNISNVPYISFYLSVIGTIVKVSVDMYAIGIYK